MSRTLVLTVLLAAWLATGIVAGFVMGYRRRDHFPWWLLGVAFGPLLVPLALGAERREEPTDQARPTLTAQNRSVPPLVAIDDSREAATALTASLRPGLDRQQVPHRDHPDQLAVAHGQHPELRLIHPMGRYLQAVVDVDGEQSRPAGVLYSHVSLLRGEPASYAAWRSTGRLGGSCAVSGARMGSRTDSGRI
jgi:hypothetical protein